MRVARIQGLAAQTQYQFAIVERRGEIREETQPDDPARVFSTAPIAYRRIDTTEARAADLDGIGPHDRPPDRVLPAKSAS